MREKRLVAFYESKETVSAEGLHQPLNSAKPEDSAKIGRDRLASRGSLRFIVGQQFFALGARESHVGIEEERRQVVLSQSGPHSLEIDEVGLAVADNDVLGLKIAMNQDARPFPQLNRDPA